MTTVSHYFNSITYAGHSAVFLEGVSHLLAIDPWLKTNPLCPDALKNPERIDTIVLTHGHSDHADDAVRLGKRYGASLYATYELAMLLKNEGYPEDKIVPMNKGGTVTINTTDQSEPVLRVTLTHALHSSSFDTAQGPRYAGEACGVVISTPGCSFYHAGDTALFSDMALIATTYAPDYAFLPCGDRFTMGPKEAACAAKLIGSKWNIPIHHTTFPLLTGTPEQFSEECRALDCNPLIIAPGTSFHVK
jgi:L-ascorbate metabolism protein UlaG (beta-lactamase superfamily)